MDSLRENIIYFFSSRRLRGCRGGGEVESKVKEGRGIRGINRRGSRWRKSKRKERRMKRRRKNKRRRKKKKKKKKRTMKRRR